ncbi:polysaccharide biosynthesis tyrosine autokinase [Phenylobacterium sp. LjRoot219]|uniref:GumC family protein n=1 Tax=Phenylobacterium sp. LjRoot219 TaxID=3342283 RepID=UPI003ECEF500
MYLVPNATRAVASPEQILDLPRVMRVARRHFRLMAIIFLAVVAAAAAVTMMMTPVYSANVELMIDKPGGWLLARGENPGETSQEALDASTVETEVEVLRSPAVAETVVRQLRLDLDPEFNSALRPPGPLDRLRGFLSSLGEAAGGTSEAERRNPIVNAVRSHLKVGRVGASYIIRLSFVSRDPRKAARIADAFAANYLRLQREAKLEASRDASAWLYGRIGEIRHRVVTAETALQAYRIQNNLLSAQGATLTEQEISSLNQQAALTRAQQAEAQARLSTAMSQLKNGSLGDDVGETLTSPVIRDLREQRAAVSQRLANMTSRYGPRHPDLVKVKSELDDLDEQIRAEIKRIISNLQAQANVARERHASLGQSVAESRQGLADSNRSLVRLNELKRDADAERILYESFLGKYKELSAEAGLVRTNAHVVSPARTPAMPSSPMKSLNLALGAVLGLAAAVTAALVKEISEKGLIDAVSVERELNIPYLGSIPNLDSIAAADDPLRERPIDYLVDKPLSGFAETFRSLRAGIEFSRLGSKVKVLAVTSSVEDEGKTTTSLGLARSAALAGVHTVVVDCDLRRQTVNHWLDAPPAVGLVEVLRGTATLDEALTPDVASGAMILPLADAHFTPEDLLDSRAMRELLGDLRRRFDLVILDTAPVILVTETRTVARQADAVLLLVRWRRTPRALAQTTVQLLAAAGATLAGVALTRVDLRQQASLHPGDPTAHYLGHKKYYQQ